MQSTTRNERIFIHEGHGRLGFEGTWLAYSRHRGSRLFQYQRNVTRILTATNVDISSICSDSVALSLGALYTAALFHYPATLFISATTAAQDVTTTTWYPNNDHMDTELGKGTLCATGVRCVLTFPGIGIEVHEKLTSAARTRTSTQTNRLDRLFEDEEAEMIKLAMELKRKYMFSYAFVIACPFVLYFGLELLARASPQGYVGAVFKPDVTSLALGLRVISLVCTSVQARALKLQARLLELKRTDKAQVFLLLRMFSNAHLNEDRAWPFESASEILRNQLDKACETVSVNQTTFPGAWL